MTYSQSIEIEKTYLAKSYPVDIESSSFTKIVDVYLPDGEVSTLRLRQKGDKFEITKKVPLKENSASGHTEYTIPLIEKEFDLLKNLSKKTVLKRRYKFTHNDFVGELDVFDGDLKGLVLVDFEFNSNADFNSFVMPDFCLTDVTEENFVAGKNLAGKNIKDIFNDLERFGYKIL